ncbi:TRAPP subunit BET5 [Sporobolomyces koalae]|uniref:TRAPP subunit BET5 n=1 Tax=Sporobolomyces koalae TaxID=500713 RepID=UPI003171B75D
MLQSLPPEIISTIYAFLSPEPPLPPCRRLVPYYRHARFNSLEIVKFDHITRLSCLFDSTVGLGECVKQVTVGFEESTEELLTRFEANPSVWADLLAKFDGLREIKCRDWMSTSLGLLSVTTPGKLVKLGKATVSILLTQLNQEDFLLHRLSILANFSSLRCLDVIVQPYDPSSSTTNAFELFPSTTPSPSLDEFPPATIHQIRELSLVGPLCDRRLQTVVASFDSVESLSLMDLFSSSQNISPLVSTIRTPRTLVSLKLSQLYSIAMPINLPPAPTISFSPFTSLATLEINIPLPNLTAHDLFLPSLSQLTFSTNSVPSLDLVHELVLNKPPSLSHLVLSHISGSVGHPVSRETYPLVVSWLTALLSNSPEGAGPFPIPGWKIPAWPAEFDPNSTEILFPLAESKGVSLEGSSLISAMLTAYVLDKQLASWRQLLDADPNTFQAEDEEMEQAFGDPRFWDALALRYVSRLGLKIPVIASEGVDEEQQDASMLKHYNGGIALPFVPSVEVTQGLQPLVGVVASSRVAHTNPARDNLHLSYDIDVSFRDAEALAKALTTAYVRHGQAVPTSFALPESLGGIVELQKLGLSDNTIVDAFQQILQGSTAKLLKVIKHFEVTHFTNGPETYRFGGKISTFVQVEDVTIDPKGAYRKVFRLPTTHRYHTRRFSSPPDSAQFRAGLLPAMQVRRARKFRLTTIPMHVLQPRRARVDSLLLYIFDKHCVCTFYTSPATAGSASTSTPAAPNAVIAPKDPGASTLRGVLPSDATPLIQDSLFSPPTETREPIDTLEGDSTTKRDGKLPFDEEAKLVYGVVFSLRNMVKKLSSRESDSFHSFSTSTYKLHSYSTPTQFHFILLTSPTRQTMRPLLKSLYVGPFNEFVVRNPLVRLDTRDEGTGIGNDKFRREVDRILSSTTV